MPVPSCLALAPPRAVSAVARNPVSQYRLRKARPARWPQACAVMVDRPDEDATCVASWQTPLIRQ